MRGGTTVIELSGKQWLLIAGACVLLFAFIGFRIASTPRPPESAGLVRFT